VLPADVFDIFRRSLGEWLNGSGPESDIVISTRVRLARNVVDFPFLTKASPRRRSDLERHLKEQIERAGIVESEGQSQDASIFYANLQETQPIDRLCLVERHLISKDLASADGDRGVALGKREIVSIMVNEEDHLRIQVLRSGFQPEQAWAQTSEIDDRLERHVNYAFSPQMGYLTACPTNCGTGLRVSVMLHLPALVMTKQIDKVFHAVGKIGLAVRGFYGEGTQASGDFYQISNQMTLGRSEQEILKQLQDVVPQIIKYERSIRETLVAENKKTLEDRVWRAYGMLRSARTITSEETMDLLSAVRMGVNLGLIDDITIATVNELFIQTQPAHLQKLEGKKLESPERDVARASFIRGRLALGTVTRA